MASRHPDHPHPPDPADLLVHRAPARRRQARLALPGGDDRHAAGDQLPLPAAVAARVRAVRQGAVRRSGWPTGTPSRIRATTTTASTRWPARGSRTRPRSSSSSSRSAACSRPLDDETRASLQAVLVPLRHYEWGANMNNAYCTAYGWGAAVTQPCMFATMDRLGLAQYLSRIGLLLDGNSRQLAGRRQGATGSTRRPGRACAA